MRNKAIIFILLPFAFFLCFSALITQSKKAEHSPLWGSGPSEQLHNKFRKVHTLRRNDSTCIGDIYVRYINDGFFTDLYVINNVDTLYTITKSSFTNKRGKDLEVVEEGFYGYKFVIYRNDYFVLSYFQNKGANISDNISINWNYDLKILEVLKTP
jgi:hypothetical protein